MYMYPSIFLSFYVSVFVCVCMYLALSLSLYIMRHICIYRSIHLFVLQSISVRSTRSFPPEPWRTRDYPVDLVHLAIAPLLQSLSVLTHTWKLAVALWCMQTRQCCIDCRACKRTHWVSLYLCIINNNFPANMKVIRALCWIHWACSTRWRRDIQQNHTGFAIHHLQSCPVSAMTGGLTIQRSRQAADPVAFRTLAHCFASDKCSLSSLVLVDKCLFCFAKCLLTTTFYYSRLLGRDLACRVIYIVSIGRFHRDCGKKGRCQKCKP